MILETFNWGDNHNPASLLCQTVKMDTEPVKTLDGLIPFFSRHESQKKCFDSVMTEIKLALHRWALETPAARQNKSEQRPIVRRIYVWGSAEEVSRCVSQRLGIEIIGGRRAPINLPDESEQKMCGSAAVQQCRGSD